MPEITRKPRQLVARVAEVFAGLRWGRGDGDVDPRDPGIVGNLHIVRGPDGRLYGIERRRRSDHD